MTALIRYLWRVLQQIAQVVVGELLGHEVVAALSESAKWWGRYFVKAFLKNRQA